MITGLHHIGLTVQDMAKAQAYYQSVAGMRLVGSARHERPPQALIEAASESVEICLLAAPNGYLELLSTPFPRAAEHIPAPINRPGIRHFCIQNHDCAILEAGVLGSGGSLIAAPLDLGTGNQYAYARDPEGNIMEIEGLPYAPVDQPTWVGHVAIVTEDMDAAVAFYSAVLDTPPGNRARVGPGPQFDRMGGLENAQLEGAWLQAGNMLLELWQFHEPKSEPSLRPHKLDAYGYSHICLETNNTATDAARLVGLGATLLAAPCEFSDCRTAYLADPEGNIIKLLEIRSPGGAIAIAALADPGVCLRVDGAR